MSDPGWRSEKAGNVIESACQLLKMVTDKNEVYAIIFDASKLYCDAVKEMRHGPNRWSPELPQFLFQHPERCADTLRIVFSEDYRDDYYKNIKKSH